MKRYKIAKVDPEFDEALDSFVRKMKQANNMDISKKDATRMIAPMVHSMEAPRLVSQPCRGRGYKKRRVMFEL